MSRPPKSDHDFGPLEFICETEKRNGYGSPICMFHCRNCGEVHHRTRHDAARGARRGQKPRCCKVWSGRKPEPRQQPAKTPPRAHRFCERCEDLAHRRPANGSPCLCGRVYREEPRPEMVLRRAV